MHKFTSYFEGPEIAIDKFNDFCETEVTLIRFYSSHINYRFKTLYTRSKVDMSVVSESSMVSFVYHMQCDIRTNVLL